VRRPAPYPEIVRELQAVIGREAREQILSAEDRLPEVAVACVGGGSNAIGLFAGFVDDAEVRLVGVEAAGAASLGTGRAGVLHGSRSSLLADDDGQVLDAHSISAGLDYPGVGPEHAFLRDTGRAEYIGASDEEALAAFRLLAETEGIIPALEPAHALAKALELEEELILVCLSGRGDKDLAEVLSRDPAARRSPPQSSHPHPLWQVAVLCRSWLRGASRVGVRSGERKSDAEPPARGNISLRRFPVKGFLRHPSYNDIYAD